MGETRKIEYDRLAFTLLAVIFAIILLWFSSRPWCPRERYGILFLVLTFASGALLSIREKKILPFKSKRKLAITGWLYVVFSLIPMVFYFQYDAFWFKGGIYTSFDYAIAIFTLYLVFHLSWKEHGPMLPMLGLLGILYSVLGPFFPGFLMHRGFDLQLIVNTLVLAMSESALFGYLIPIIGTWVAIFALFGGIVQGFKGLDIVMKITWWALRKIRIPALLPQLAVFASSAFGTFSGSGVANSSATGQFTIPMMKRFAVHPENAAAIEAIASTGGMIVPPIMGAVAFIMAEFLGVPYLTIILVGILPAFLYYFCTAIATYFIGIQEVRVPRGSDTADEALEVIGKREVMQIIPILLGLSALIFALAGPKVGIMLAGFILITTYLISRLVYDVAIAKGSISFVPNYVMALLEGIRIGVRIIVSVGLMVAPVAILVKALMITGLVQKISYFIVDWSGGSTAILYLLIALISILFGMACPPLVVYILVGSVALPAMDAAGVGGLAAHFSLFYFSVLGELTPPVGPVCMVTAGIAGASYLKTCKKAVMLGLPVFIMPFIFLTWPKIVNVGSIDSLIALGFSATGLTALVMGIWVPTGRKIAYPLKLILALLGCAILFFTSGVILYACEGVAIVLIIFLWRAYFLPKAAGLSEFIE